MHNVCTIYYFILYRWTHLSRSQRLCMCLFTYKTKKKSAASASGDAHDPGDSAALCTSAGPRTRVPCATDTESSPNPAHHQRHITAQITCLHLLPPGAGPPGPLPRGRHTHRERRRPRLPLPPSDTTQISVWTRRTRPVAPHRRSRRIKPARPHRSATQESGVLIRFFAGRARSAECRVLGSECKDYLFVHLF